MTEDEWAIKQIELVPRLTGEFLATLAECVRVYGNAGDSVANRDFAAEMFRLRDIEPPDMTPYDQNMS